jgi:general secretion pathway protein F
MAAFEYLALDDAGRRTRGVVAADTARAARREIRQRQLTLVKLEESRARARADAQPGASAPAPPGRGALSESDRVLVTRQLATLLQAGTPLEEALGAIAAQAPRQAARRTLLHLRSSVTEGFRFSEALAGAGRGFDGLYRAMAAAGEATGDLGGVLARLADLLERGCKARQKVLAAVVYPIVLACVALTVVTCLMVFVVPRVVDQFESFDQRLPLVTEVVIALSNAARAYGLVAAAVVAGAGLLVARALALKPFRRLADGLVLKLPLLGGYLRATGAARFARTMAALLRSGVQALDALEASKMTMGNLVLREAVETMGESVRRGGGIAAAMQAAGVFPPLLTFLAASGERSGELGAMFEKGADYLEAETEAGAAVALNLLEPGIIVLMGGVVATIVLAIMLPILRLNALALS